MTDSAALAREPKPTRDEMAALVDLAKRLRKLPIPDCVRAADAIEALMQERAEVRIDYPILASTTQEAMGAPPAKPAGELPPHRVSDLVANMRGLGMVAAKYIEHHYRDASGPIREILDAAAAILPHAADELESAYALRAIREQRE